MLDVFSRDGIRIDLGATTYEVRPDRDPARFTAINLDSGEPVQQPAILGSLFLHVGALDLTDRLISRDILKDQIETYQNLLEKILDLYLVEVGTTALTQVVSTGLLAYVSGGGAAKALPSTLQSVILDAGVTSSEALKNLGAPEVLGLKGVQNINEASAALATFIANVDNQNSLNAADIQNGVNNALIANAMLRDGTQMASEDELLNRDSFFDDVGQFFSTGDIRVFGDGDLADFGSDLLSPALSVFGASGVSNTINPTLLSATEKLASVEEILQIVTAPGLAAAEIAEDLQQFYANEMPDPYFTAAARTEAIALFSEGAVDDGPAANVASDLVDDEGAPVGSFAAQAPTYVADGETEYTLSLAGLGTGIQFNIAYIIDTSGSMRGSEIVDARNAYVELTNQLRDRGIADAASFAVIPFTSSARSFAPLDPDEAIERIEGLSAGGGTRFTQALDLAEQFFDGSSENQTNVAYFLSDGRGSGASGARADVANVQAFALGSRADLDALDIIDSDDAERLSSSDQLADVLTGARLDEDDIARIEVFLNGSLVETVSGEQLQDGPLGLQYTGTVSGLRTGPSADNTIRAVAYLDDNSEAGAVEITLGSGYDTRVDTDADGVQTIALGAFDQSYDVDSLGTTRFDLKSNDRDNEINATGGSGQIRLYKGDDLVFRGKQADGTDDVAIDGGGGFDIVVYAGEYLDYTVQRFGNIIQVGENTDTLTNVEAVEFDDGFLDTDTFTFTANEAPVAVDDVFGGDEDAVLEGDVLADNGNGEDSDPNAADRLTAVVVDGPSSGNLTFADDGTFTYEPDTNFNGTDQFTYRLSDGSLQSDVATATIEVAPVNDAPRFSATAYTLSVPEDAAVGTSVGTVAADDVEGDDLVFAPQSLFGGAFALDPTSGEITTTTSLDYETQRAYGSTGIAVSDDDANRGTDLADLTIDVIDVNDDNEAPTVADDTYQVAAGAALAPADGVLTNDDDPEDDPVTAVLEDGVVNGTLELNEDGSFTYTPDDGFVGVDRFTYRAEDGAAESDVATVEITVEARNSAPTGIALSETTVAEGALGAVVGELSTADVDGGDSHVYTLLEVRDATGAVVQSPFEIDGSTLKLKDGVALDYEVMAAYEVTLRTTDRGGLDDVETLDVAVQDTSDWQPGFTASAVNDWYDPRWGGGFNASFSYLVQEADVAGGTVSAWELAPNYAGTGELTRAWASGFGAGIDVGPNEEDDFVLSTVDQGFQRALVPGDRIDFTVQVRDSGYDPDAFAFAFVDRDPEPNPAAADDLAIDAAPTNDWGGGLTQRVAVENAGPDLVDSWSIGLDVPDGVAIDVRNAWGASVSSTARNDFVFAGLAWNDRLAAGESTSFGFRADYTGADNLSFGDGDFALL